MDIPAPVLERLAARNFWHCVTLNPDGSASATPVWVDTDGTHVLVNTAVGRRKERNLRRDARVVLSMIDRDDPYTYAEITGRVAEFVEGSEADTSFDAMARKYQGRDALRRPGEHRLLLRIEPTAVNFRVDPGSPAFRPDEPTPGESTRARRPITAADVPGDEVAAGLLTTAVADRRVLIKGATLVTMDPAIPSAARGDILVVGRTIAAVGEDLSAVAGVAGAIVLDANGLIAMPGLHDTHRHCWQGQLRRLAPNADIERYGELVHRRLAPHYRPEDIYVGNLVSALSALDSGVTCLGDFSHNLRSPEHTDSGLQAFVDAGVRVVHASSGAFHGDWAQQWPKDLLRLKETWFASNDSLLTLRLGVFGTFALGRHAALTPEKIAFARQLEIDIVADGVAGADSSGLVEELARQQLLGSDMTFVHCSAISSEAWRLMADADVNVALAVTSDMHLGIGDSVPPIEQALQHGICLGLCVDSEVVSPPDLFTQMRALYFVERMRANTHGSPEESPASDSLSVERLLEYATVGGATVNGVLERTGTLTPGKDADIVLVDGNGYQTLPLNHAVGTVVLAADSQSVRTVFVRGELKKFGGQLVEHDLRAVLREAERSRDYLAARAELALDALD